MKLLVWSEREALALELARGAQTIGRDGVDPANGSVVMARFGGPRPATSACPADEVIWTAEAHPDDPDWCVDALVEVITRTAPEIVLVGATKLGLEVAPRLAERVRAAYAPWAVAFERRTPGVAITCTSYAGVGQTTLAFRSGRVVATVAPATLPGDGDVPATQVETMEMGLPEPRVTILGDRPKARGAGLEGARIVVDVGQGVRERADLGLIERLARTLDAQIACSRPMAADRDWFPEWLGLSGTRIRPALCLTIGISGAVQHLVGIRDSRVIAAVNNDEDAPIFAQADVGVVADLYEFLPVLVRRLRERGVVAERDS
jgi:electron transfer flavoprotein alpha subunit